MTSLKNSSRNNDQSKWNEDIRYNVRYFQGIRVPVFIVAALNILNLTMIAQLIESMINYLPNLFAGVLY
jgi:hypothetical protein